LICAGGGVLTEKLLTLHPDMDKLEPEILVFRPNLKKVVWGGDRLTAWKGLDSQDSIGESWEVSAVSGSESIVDGGAFDGMSLPEVISMMPDEMLGRQVAERYDGKMPLLVKFIDARSDLSIQVHPSDEMARRVHGGRGKSEMWYVIDAKPGAHLYAGFKQELDAERYEAMVKDGTICQALACHDVHPGDVFYLPAGRVHAICGGILLAEVQQSSDLTYRIFDYGRPGLDGKPRQLHTALAAQALDFKVLDEYRTIYNRNRDSANRVVESPYFSVRVTQFGGTFHRNLKKYDSFIICMCLKGNCEVRLRNNGASVMLKEGYSCLVPAAVANYDLVAQNGECRVLDAFIDNMDRSLAGRVTRFLHISNN